MAAVGEARPGYELWRPNRETSTAKTTKAVVALVLLISAALLIIITLGGWERLQSGGVGAATIAWALLYVAMAFFVFNWQRGLLPVAASLAVIMVIFAAVAAPGWFERAKDGLESPALPEELLGLLTLVVIPVQILLVAVAMIAFNQEWHVEEERPIAGGPADSGDPAPAEPVAAEADADPETSPTERAPSYPDPPAEPGPPQPPQQGWTPPSAGATPTA